MSTIIEFDTLSSEVLSNLDIAKLPKIELSTAKKILKLPDKSLTAFVKGYNEGVTKNPLTYYSHRIDNKLVILATNDTGFIGTVAEIRKGKSGKGYCHFCNTLRFNEEIGFISNSKKSKEGNYAAWGNECCLDYELCNSDILTTDKLVSFINKRQN